jgi:Tol biopolymer transport system component
MRLARLLPSLFLVALAGWLRAPSSARAATAVAEAARRAASAPDTTPGKGTKDRASGKPLPLQTADTLRLTESEGSWMSLDVNPDGRRIVFDYLGDLYVLPIDGGEATPLTTGQAFDGQPRFSPDGKRVAFVSDRSGSENLWIVSVDGRDTVQVTKGKHDLYQSPEWTPDGHYLVASKQNGFAPAKPWMYHVEGGTGIQLVKDPEGSGGGRSRGLRLTGAAFGKDPRYIWFAQREGTWQYNAIFPQYELVEYDRKTGETFTRTDRYGSAFRPTLSPDGRWLVYGTRHDAQTGLRIRDLATGQEKWLAYPVQRDDQESSASRDVYPGMSFTPDSKALVVTYGGKIWRVPVDGSAPSEIPFTVHTDVPLGPRLDFEYPIPDSATFVVRQIRDAVPSPDGTRLAFTALDRLYVMDWPDGQPKRLTSSEDLIEAEPTWSPDGGWIAYATWSDSAGGDLYRIRSDGSGRPQRLTTMDALYQEPAWSPDGERIVAVRGPARTYFEHQGPFEPGAREDLVWVPASGGTATVIAPTEGRGNPHFTRAEPDRIFLYSVRDGLVSIRWDGTDSRSYLKVTGATPPGSRQPLRADEVYMGPDEQRALAHVNHQVYVVTVPFVGGETPTVSVGTPDKAAVPVKKLTDVGGQFIAWGADGGTVHWSIGNAHFAYDLVAARAAEDSVKAAKRAEAREKAAEKGEEEAGEDKGAGAEATEPEATEEEGKDEKEEPAYRPVEKRVVVRAPRDIPRGTLVLRGARVVTMKGDQVIENADLVIRDARIEGVGARGQVTIPEGANIMDVSGETIIPGYVDTHAHPWPVWGLHKTQVPKYMANLAYGVTTTRDPQTSTTDVLTYADRVEAGRMLGPRIFSTGPGVFSSEMISSLDEARDVLDRYSEYYHTRYIKMYMTGNRQQRQWVIMAAREQHLLPTTEGGLDLKLDMTHVLDGYPGHEHALPIFPLYDDVIQLMAHTKSAYTPTLIVAYGGPWGENYYYTRHNPHDDAKLRHFTPHQELDSKTRRRGQGTGPGPGGWFRDDEHVFSHIATYARKIMEAGGRLGIGSHGQLDGLGYDWELWMVASGGMTPMQALRVATIMGADDLGLDGDLGSVEPGKLADLQVLDRNPLEDIHNTNSIRYVMKNGRLYDGNTLDEVWPRQVKPAGVYWLGQDPVGVAAGVRERD